MSWPALPVFGLVNNPLIDSPFVYNNETGEAVPPIPQNGMLFLTNSAMLFLDGGDMQFLGV